MLSKHRRPLLYAKPNPHHHLLHRLHNHDRQPTLNAAALPAAI